ncbi:hypothetical protein [Neisseria dumasiana]|uniref:LpxL/LpxP family acyltransferase n=1 Tax=Neisseria dumasiana TaxID=1931275 RepID=UPI002FCE1E78
MQTPRTPTINFSHPARHAGLLPITNKLKKGHPPFFYLPDKFSARKIRFFFIFLGFPASPIEPLSRFAALTNAKVLRALPTREHDGTVKLRFFPELENFSTDNVVTDTQRMNDLIESRVPAHPKPYFRLHKRFHTRPDRSAEFF